MGSGKTSTILASGLVSMGIITALFLPGRQTAKGIAAAGTAGQGLFRTAISGK